MMNSLEQDKIAHLANGRAIGYAEYGDPNGVPVFYFHGTPGSRLDAANFDEQAGTHGYRLIGIDRPGMGLSTFDKKRSLLSWANDVAAFADCLHIDKFSIIGHSGGGPYVAACAYAIPERLNGAAIVSAVGPFENPKAQIGLATQYKVMNAIIKIIPFGAHFLMWITQKMLNKPDEMQKQMIKQFSEPDQVVFRDPEAAKSYANSMREAFRHGVAGTAYEMRLFLKPWNFNLTDIKIPVTIWYGALDKQAPRSHADIYADLIPNSRLNVLENEGHLSLIKNHFAEILAMTNSKSNR